MLSQTMSELNRQQIGQFAEYYAKMLFASYGFYVYTSEVDDHGVDFVAKSKAGVFYEVQVKSVHANYAFIPKDKITLSDTFLVCYMLLCDENAPDVYVIPSTVWKNPSPPFVYHPYDKPGRRSEPEYGINYNKKQGRCWRNTRQMSRYRNFLDNYENF